MNSTSICSWSDRSSTFASAASVSSSARAVGGPTRDLGHSVRATTTFVSAA
jgi:predicted Rdx family selenoprotein